MTPAAHRRAVLEGQRKARAAGVKFGRKPGKRAPDPEQVRGLRKLGLSWADIAANCGCSVGQARRAAER